MTLPLRTERLVVREFTADDAADLGHAFSSAEVIWWDADPFTLEKAHAWIGKALDRYARSGLGLYAVCLATDGRLIGDRGLVVRTVEGHAPVEVGWHLERSAWGRSTSPVEGRSAAAA